MQINKAWVSLTMSSIVQTWQGLSCSAQITALLCGALGVYLTYRVRRRIIKSSVPAIVLLQRITLYLHLQIGDFATFGQVPDGEYKMVILVRTDINMVL